MRRGRSGERPRRIDAATMAALSPLPPPEEVFVDWLLSVPHGTDLEGAARSQIELIDSRPQSHPAAQCLRTLLLAMAGGHWHARAANI